MTELSDNEMKILRAILTNEAHDAPLGAERIGSSVWCASINEATEPSGIKDGKIQSAIVSLLSQKKLVVTDGEMIELTQAGYEAAAKS
jgi:hypothetical protein